MTNPRSDDGFTLLEVMVVGILLAVGIPTYLGAQSRAQDRNAQASVRTGITSASAIFTDAATFAGAGPGGLAAVEPAFTYVDAPTASTDPEQLSIDVSVDGSVWGVASLSESGTCFYARVDADGGTTFGSSDSISCAGDQALTVTGTDFAGGTPSVLYVSVADAEIGSLFEFDGTGYGVPNGVGYASGPSGDDADAIHFDFIVTEPGTYRFVGTISAPNGSDDSFWVTVDDTPGGGYLWDTGYLSYGQSTVNNRYHGVVERTLDAGEHRVTLWHREDGTYVSSLALVLQS